MINPFNKEIHDYDNTATYGIGEKVVFNFSVYVSTEANNESIPSTGNQILDGIMAEDLGRECSNNWIKL